MTQPQHGPSRTEVSDLRNIVDRLDLLMSGPGPRTSRAGGSSPREEAIAALGERVRALESDVEELRTLVNHLMTIATWQAKVTATLVDDRADDGEPSEPDPSASPRGGGHLAPAERHRDGDGTGRRWTAAPATALDDDIDDILGADRDTSHHDPPPPDFGI